METISNTNFVTLNNQNTSSINGGGKTADTINGLAGGLAISWSGVAGAAAFVAGATPIGAVCVTGALICGGAYAIWNSLD